MSNTQRKSFGYVPRSDTANNSTGKNIKTGYQKPSTYRPAKPGYQKEAPAKYVPNGHVKSQITSQSSSTKSVDDSVIQFLKNEIQSLTNQLAEKDNELRLQTLKNISSPDNSTKTQLAKSEKIIASLKNKVSALERENKFKNTEIKNLKAECFKLKGEYTRHQKLSEKEPTVVNHSHNGNKLAIDIALTQLNEKLSSEIKLKDKKIDSLEKLNKKQIKTIDNLKNTNKNLQAKLNKLSVKLADKILDSGTKSWSGLESEKPDPVKSNSVKKSYSAKSEVSEGKQGQKKKVKNNQQSQHSATHLESLSQTSDLIESTERASIGKNSSADTSHQVTEDIYDVFRTRNNFMSNQVKNTEKYQQEELNQDLDQKLDDLIKF